jgi:hypothetical protein
MIFLVTLHAKVDAVQAPAKVCMFHDCDQVFVINVKLKIMSKNRACLGGAHALSLSVGHARLVNCPHNAVFPGQG